MSPLKAVCQIAVTCHQVGTYTYKAQADQCLGKALKPHQLLTVRASELKPESLDKQDYRYNDDSVFLGENSQQGTSRSERQQYHRDFATQEFQPPLNITNAGQQHECGTEHSHSLHDIKHGADVQWREQPAPRQQHRHPAVTRGLDIFKEQPEKPGKQHTIEQVQDNIRLFAGCRGSVEKQPFQHKAGHGDRPAEGAGPVAKDKVPGQLGILSQVLDNQHAGAIIEKCGPCSSRPVCPTRHQHQQ